MWNSLVSNAGEQEGHYFPEDSAESTRYVPGGITRIRTSMRSKRGQTC